MERHSWLGDFLCKCSLSHIIRCVAGESEQPSNFDCWVAAHAIWWAIVSINMGLRAITFKRDLTVPFFSGMIYS